MKANIKVYISSSIITLSSLATPKGYSSPTKRVNGINPTCIFQVSQSILFLLSTYLCREWQEVANNWKKKSTAPK